MSSALNIPIFPLHTVLFPGGILPLRVFEPRYTDMISECLRTDSQFGVCLIREGNEVGGGASTHATGTLAKIHDWHMRHDGLLGVTVLGGERFEIETESVRRNHLLTASVTKLAPEPSVDIPLELNSLIDLLQDIMDQVGYRYNEQPKLFSDASWVGFRLAELLPLKLSQKQYFLQLSDPIIRLERLVAAFEKLNLV